MKKKRIELNQKLFLNKEKIVSLDNHQQSELAGGGTGTVCFSGATSPCGVCAETQNAGCLPTQVTQPANLCNYAASVEANACHATYNFGCASVATRCNGASDAGTICTPRPIQ